MKKRDAEESMRSALYREKMITNETMDRGTLQIKAKANLFRRALSCILMTIPQVSTREHEGTTNEDLFQLALSSILITIPQVSTREAWSEEAWREKYREKMITNKTMDRGTLQIKAKVNLFRRALSYILMTILQVSTSEHEGTTNEDLFQLALSSILMTITQVSIREA